MALSRNARGLFVLPVWRRLGSRELLEMSERLAGLNLGAAVVPRLKGTGLKDSKFINRIVKKRRRAELGSWVAHSRCS